MYVLPLRLKQWNNALACVVVVFGLYLIIQPLLPQVSYFFSHSSVLGWFRKTDEVVPEPGGKIHALTPRVSMAATKEHTLVAPVPDENTLIIPDIDVKTTILEGQSAQVLMNGIWHRPGTGTPDTGGNTVLVGHRFLYTSGPHTFYHLDKLKVNDPITIYWKGKRYSYIIDSSTITSDDSFEIEQSTAQPVLTLYTCTPLFSVDKRLVVRAHQITVTPEQVLSLNK